MKLDGLPLLMSCFFPVTHLCSHFNFCFHLICSRISRPLLSWQHNRNQSNVNSVKNLQVSGGRWTPCRSVAGFQQFNSAQRSSSASGRFSGNDGRSSGFGGRLSGLSALGGIGSRSRYDVPKDPRPISDKAYQCGCIQNLIQVSFCNLVGSC